METPFTRESVEYELRSLLRKRDLFERKLDQLQRRIRVLQDQLGRAEGSGDVEDCSFVDARAPARAPGAVYDRAAFRFHPWETLRGRAVEVLLNDGARLHQVELRNAIAIKFESRPSRTSLGPQLSKMKDLGLVVQDAAGRWLLADRRELTGRAKEYMDFFMEITRGGPEADEQQTAGGSEVDRSERSGGTTVAK